MFYGDRVVSSEKNCLCSEVVGGGSGGTHGSCWSPGSSTRARLLLSGSRTGQICTSRVAEFLDHVVEVPLAL